MDIQNLYNTLRRKGLINMSFDEFSRLDQSELQELGNAVQAEYQLSGMIEPDADMNVVAPEGTPADVGITGGKGATAQGAGTGGWGWSNTPKGKAGNFIGQAIAGAAQIGGNAMQKKTAADSAANIGGDILAGAGQGAAAGMAFGPWGALIGGAIGAIGGGIKGGVEKAQYRKGLRHQQTGHRVGNLGTSMNPELEYGGLTPTMAERSVVAYNKAGNGVRTADSLGSHSRVLRAGYPSYQQGGVVPSTMQEDTGMANAEIEGGEAVIGNPQGVQMYGGADYNTSSPMGFMAEGAQHGQLNQAGSEGIPIKSDEEMYIGSEKLTLDGHPAGKKYGKSVAQEMKPFLKYAEKATNSQDAITSNPAAIAQINQELKRLQVEAERGKFMKGLDDLLNKKERDYEDIMNYIMEENPNDFKPVDPTASPKLPDLSQQPQQQPMQLDPAMMQQGAPQAMPQEMGMPMGTPQGAEQMDPAMMEQMMQMQGGQMPQEPMMRNGGIYINPANKGKFTASANRAGMSVQGFANKVLANPDNYSSTQVKRANFARNAANWKHQDGGIMNSAVDNNSNIDMFNNMNNLTRYNNNQTMLNRYRMGGKPCYTCGGKMRPRYQDSGVYNPEQSPEEQAYWKNLSSQYADKYASNNSEIQGMLTDYASTKQVPPSLVKSAMRNYTNQVPSGFLDNAEQFGNGVAKMNYVNQETYDNPIIAAPVTSNYSREIKNPQASIQNAANDNMVFQAYANREFKNNPTLGFFPYNQESHMLSPEGIAFLKQNGFSDDEIVQYGSNVEDLSDPNNPLVKAFSSNISGVRTTMDNQHGAGQGTYGDTQGRGGGNRNDEAMKEWFISAAKKGQFGKGNREVFEQLDPNDPMFLQKLKTVVGPDVYADMNNQYKSAFKGTEIGRKDITSYKKSVLTQKSEKDLTGVEITPGRIATLEEAARLAGSNDWSDFIYDGEVYDVPKTMIKSYKKPTSTKPRNSSTPYSGNKSNSNQGYIKGNQNRSPVLQSKGKAYNQSTESTRYSTEYKGEGSKRNGGIVNGQRITFQHGGKLYSGKVTNYNPYTGDFDLS